MLLPVPHRVNAEGTWLSCVVQEDDKALSGGCGRRHPHGIRSLVEEVTSTALRAPVEILEETALDSKHQVKNRT